MRVIESDGLMYIKNQDSGGWNCIGMVMRPNVVDKNPFHFLEDFDSWFEFERRKEFEGQEPESIVRDIIRRV